MKLQALFLALVGLSATAAAVPTVQAQSTMDEPFAVTSRGRPAPRTERLVVVIGDTAATTAADSAGGSGPATTARPGTTTAPPAANATTPPPRGSTGSSTAGTTARPPAAAPPAPTTGSTTRPTTGSSTASARPAGAAGRTHTIAWGDTWLGIANRYGVSSSALQAANPDVDPERIVSGRVIRIPNASQPAASTRRTHRVVAGESLLSIARRYDVTTGAIRRANDLDGDRIRTGQTLVIPEED